MAVLRDMVRTKGMSKLLLASLFTVAGAIVASSQPTMAARTSVSVPVELRGRWAAIYDTIVEPCHPRYPDDAKRSMTANRTEFRYWEARAMPTKVRRAAANVFVIEVDAVGEGASWHKRMTFSLADHGRKLVTDDIYDDNRIAHLRYKRCGL